MAEIIALTGEIKTGKGDDVLKSSPIGSCIALVLFDEGIDVGGMAHIMLPGRAPEKKGTITGRYAENAIEEIVALMLELGARKSHLKAVIAGGGNVLKREGEVIGELNLNAVSNLLGFMKIPILAKSVGGTDRKMLRFDIGAGIVYCSEGDNKEIILYKLTPK